MAGYASTSWYFWIGGVVTALGGLLLLYRALLHDRSRGRRRCPRCWYDMSGTPGNAEPPNTFTCSECGKFIKRERTLYKTRRRWRWAIVAIVIMCLSDLVFEFPRYQREGWAAFLPNTVLIVMNPYLVMSRPSAGFATVRPISKTCPDLFSGILYDRMDAASSTDRHWCGLYSWQWWLLIRQARVLDAPLASGSHSPIVNGKSVLYDEVLKHAVQWGSHGEWPFYDVFDDAQRSVVITGATIQFQGHDRVSWAIRRNRPASLRRILAIHASPGSDVATQPDCPGPWVPRELVLNESSELAIGWSIAAGPPCRRS